MNPKSSMNVHSIDFDIQARQVSLTGPALSDDDLRYFCEVIEQVAGISLKMSKKDLVRTRLRSRLAATEIPDYSAYRQYLAGVSKSDPEWQQFINALTTNKTDFFREAKHFEYIVEKILPAWVATGATTLNVWSAASSTGEEVYTLAMVLSQHLPLNRGFRITGTDIDTEVLRIAHNAVYPIYRLPEIPPLYHANCLDKGRRDVRDWFRIRANVRDKVHFGQHNLVTPQLPRVDTFDLVFCRNVLIYFAQENIAAVCRKLYAMTKENGHLFIGHSESFQGIKHSWNSVGPSVYQKRSS